MARSTTRSTTSAATGSTTSSQPDTSHPDASIVEASPISPPQMSLGLDNDTSSPEFLAGLTPSGSPESPTTPTSGPAVHRVSRSPARARGAERATLDIFGQHGQHSSRSVALQSSLEKRLRVAMDSLGSTLFSLTWNDAVTPSGRVILARRASVLRTPDSDSCSWPTPVKEDARSSARHGYMITGNQGTTLLDAARLAAWPASRAVDGEKGTVHAKDRPDKTGHDLPTIAGRAHWSTPLQSDEHGVREADGKRGIGLNSQAQLATWSTPKASDAMRGGQLSRNFQESGGGRSNLVDRVQLAGWATPVSTELGNTLENYRAMKRNMKSGPRMAITHPSLQAQLVVSGEMPSGSPASTESRGQLNPCLSRWLQGFPVTWDTCAPRERVARTSRRSSTKPTAESPDSAGTATPSSRRAKRSSSEQPSTPSEILSDDDG